MANMTEGSAMFAVASDVECAAIDLENVGNVLYLFDELLQDAVEGVDPNQPYTAQNLKNRFPLLLSMLHTVIDSLTQATAAVSAISNRAYEAARKERNADADADS